MFFKQIPFCFSFDAEKWDVSGTFNVTLAAEAALDVYLAFDASARPATVVRLRSKRLG
jgi:hypothetical protein